MLGAAVWCTSCVDLNYSEVTTNNEEWVYQSPQYGIEHLVSSVYARVPNGLSKNFEGGSGATFAAACDEADCALSHDNIRKLYNGGWSPINPFSYLWENSYKAIAEANKAKTNFFINTGFDLIINVLEISILKMRCKIKHYF